jgi:hypothetical protein
MQTQLYMCEDRWLLLGSPENTKEIGVVVPAIHFFQRKQMRCINCVMPSEDWLCEEGKLSRQPGRPQVMLESPNTIRETVYADDVLNYGRYAAY